MFRVFDLFLRSVLTIVGTVSLVSILMFLNSRFGVSYFSCFLITLIVPSFYSLCINAMLDSIMDNKIRKIMKEIKELEKEYSKDKDSVIKNIEIRFEGLSNVRKRELLNYIKERMPDSSCYEYMSSLEEDESKLIFDNNNMEKECNSQYVRSKRK